MVRGYARRRPYKVYVDTGESVWSTNSLKFDTREQAEEYGSNLMSRWMLVREYRAVQVPEDFPEMHLTRDQIEKLEMEEGS